MCNVCRDEQRAQLAGWGQLGHACGAPLPHQAGVPPSLHTAAVASPPHVTFMLGTLLYGAHRKSCHESTASLALMQLVKCEIHASAAHALCSHQHLSYHAAVLVRMLHALQQW